MTWLVWAGVGFVFAVFLELLRLNVMLYRVLREQPGLPRSHGYSEESSPLLSIVIPAKDEERNIEQTVRSILASDHERVQLILVDDRSRDRTRDIMLRLAKEDARVEVLSIEDLPDDWTGKTHAMYEAAKLARGDVLLFSDADTVLDPSALSRTLGFFRKEQIDVLCLLPGFTERRFNEDVVHPHLAIGFSYFHPLSEVNDPAKPTAMASGCFIMIGKQAYEQVGTWKRFRNEITEDVALSKAVKAAGLKLRLLRGAALVRTQPFGGIRDLCRFWKRTFYGGFEKSIVKLLRLLMNYAVLTTLAVIFFWSGALWMFGTPSTAVATLFAVSALAMAAAIIPTCIVIHQEGGSWAGGLATPLGCLISAWVVCITLMTVVTDRGIRWRGARYK
jgi:cellulose synthase/poly-beta-1,6-N-acetylglucosamine synthase-like glycosyltransferase